MTRATRLTKAFAPRGLLRAVVFLLALFVGSVVASLGDSQAIAATSLPAGFEETLVAGGLGSPTAMAFSPDGRLFVAEQAGKLRVIKNGVLLQNPFLTVSVVSNFERGLLGVAFDPNFGVNGHVYVYYTASSNTRNRVSRFTASVADPDVADLNSELLILDISDGVNGYHNGGAIHFGSDGMLYVAVGDAHKSWANPQLMNTLAGKLLRIDASSFPNIVPPDNPFVGVPLAREEIWALGLRNPFTFAVDSGTGKIHINDVGKDTSEEINLGVAGANYGWPNCEGACSPPDPAFQDPIHAYPHQGQQAAITGGAFYRGNQFPVEYVGDYLFADYLRGFIQRLTPANQVLQFATAASGPVDLKVAPDGSLYYLSVFDKAVYKIAYVGSGNQNPTAVASANPPAGPAPLTVDFSGAGSSDPDGDPLTCTWAFGDGASNATGIAVSHTYSVAGQYNAVLTVDDGQGGQDSDTVTIAVGTPPVGTITSPAPGATYNAGDTIFYAGTGTDAEDGDLPASAFSWTILFHHSDHPHSFLGPINGVASGSFAIPKTGETADNVWYRIYLTVTDSTGLTHESTRDVLPNKSTMTFETNPPGLNLTLDGSPFTAPQPVVGVVGIPRTLGAPSPQVLSGITYEFESWSDGGLATHTIDTPAIDTTYTAVYRDSSPVAQDQAATTNEDTPVVITLAASDWQQCDLSFATVVGPANGTLSPTTDQGCTSDNPNTDSATLTYTPNLDSNGSDSFTYKANDGVLNSNTATVTITVTPVNDAPVAVDDAATTLEDTAVDIAALANDTDVEADTLTVASVTQGAQGAVAINPG